MTRLSISDNEHRVIAHAIGWRLHGPFGRTSPSVLSEEDRQALRILFNELCAQRTVCDFSEAPLLIEIGDRYRCENGRMQLSVTDFDLVKDAVASFLAELQHSPIELEVVAGAPASVTSDLLSRMQAMP